MKSIKFNPTEKLLKNNKWITIRECLIEDVEELIKTIKSYIIESEHIPIESDEFNPTIDQEKLWIQSFLNNGNSILLVAVYNNQIIGNIDLTGSQRRALQHTAVIGMGILKEWRNVGLGKTLLNCAIEWAKQNHCLEKLWLQVYSNNSAGILLYNKAGFVEDGVQKNLLKQGRTSILTMF